MSIATQPLSHRPPPPATPQPQVFIPHATADSHLTSWVEAQVSAVGLSPYLAEHDVRPGKDMSSKIQAAIDESVAVVATWGGREHPKPLAVADHAPTEGHSSFRELLRPPK